MPISHLIPPTFVEGRGIRLPKNRHNKYEYNKYFNGEGCQKGTELLKGGNDKCLKGKRLLSKKKKKKEGRKKSFI